MDLGIKVPRSQKLVDFAYSYAEKAHGLQLRKYTKEPYINHPVAVARLVSTVTLDIELISAALLHDTIEDCGETFESISNAGFGCTIAKLVMEVSDVSKPLDGNRATRKAIDRQHLSNASPAGKTIKLADIIDNSKSILEYDPKFAKVYMAEIAKLLPVLSEGDVSLHNPILWSFLLEFARVVE